MTSEVKKKTERYSPAAIEAKWQERWASSGLHNTPDASDKPNFYFVTMYPYPSGELHVGHWYAMAPSDAAARFLRMQGHNVLFPMGFDAFGLPAENAAIKRKMHPAAWTEKNMAHMREQFRMMGASIDWRREVVTCYPEYYRWNQWIFLKLLETGLAYRAKAPVNWCPKDETVLANEQVIAGRCERCETPVVRRDLEQWFFRITAYADELLRFEGIDWPERVRVMQTNWIGRSEGAEISFAVEGHPDERIRFFTTRPDTIYGATFMVLAPEHPLVSKITAPARRKEVDDHVARARNMAEIERTSAERERTGVDTGAFARNEFTGERVPIWVADYVLATYGTGAIMAVPAHDDRDFDFAKRHGLEIREVISPDGKEHDALNAAYLGEGLMVRSGRLTGTRSEEGKRAVAMDAERRGIGGPSVTYRLRDWLISRQRYWGTPIPVVYCDDCGIVPVPEKDLPVILPRDAPFTGEGGNPLARVESFVRTRCPRCGKAARRETDTMDTFVDSSWYVYRYPDPKIESAFMNEDLGRKWLPVARYTGGIEHAILHLLYARFVAKALRDMDFLWFGEPFKHLRNQGTIVFGGRKMSKSRGNVQAPDEYVARYGADTLRMFLMFMGPWTEGSDWDASGIEGVHRFLNRVWTIALGDPGAGPRDRDVDRALHRTIQKVTADLEGYHFNTAIAAMMELANALQHARGPSRAEATEKLILLLAPFAPFVTEELWERRGGTGSVHQQRWPTFDPALAAADQITLVIQVDGKVRDRVAAPAGLSEPAAEEIARASAKAKAALDGREVDRVVVVPDRLVNIVTRRRR
ncbi:MAG TPA: leucine--tRNA ligase [Candidatus Limnocylindria bacterium]|jgi:leucyl-tRNA synthetase|nr:leucine--tRNA ligase [Candidatus Limnocylindria bacterium]